MNTRNKQIFFGLLVIVAIFIAGCDSVTMRQPLSAEPQPIDREQFEGSWRIDGPAILHIRFGDDGVGRLAYLEWEDGEFRVRRGQMIVTEGREHNFLSVRFQEDGKWGEYHLAQYRFTPQGDLIVWLPHISSFVDAVEGERLAGEIERGRHATHVTLTGDPEEILRFINDPDKMRIFSYRNPIVVKKLAGVE